MFTVEEHYLSVWLFKDSWPERSGGLYIKMLMASSVNQIQVSRIVVSKGSLSCKHIRIVHVYTVLLRNPIFCDFSGVEVRTPCPLWIRPCAIIYLGILHLLWCRCIGNSCAIRWLVEWHSVCGSQTVIVHSFTTKYCSQCLLTGLTIIWWTNHYM